MAIDEDGLESDMAIAVAKPAGPPPTIAQSMHRCHELEPFAVLSLNANEVA
eukprot:CAMPEP_0198266010 /NCGR_PEP_ID=MMETSP1447-20131203/25925_1 /TAXON_ID=420782 /ORGANISM="Chaetoceros dichaeta, Strain CCMP1751" /LENGTH=50 /DNA_ID=CAMNT_0043955837 /DNA_START=268 /DNA_END=417 /DNA_ORIENTATION=+